jgi:hypothetical protein
MVTVVGLQAVGPRLLWRSHVFGVKRVGRRSYILGNTYTVRDHLKSEGARWDPDEHAWWVGDHDKAV